MTFREEATSEMARAPWSYSFWASTMTKTLSEVVGSEGGTPRRERKDLPDCGFDILVGIWMRLNGVTMGWGFYMYNEGDGEVVGMGYPTFIDNLVNGPAHEDPSRFLWSDWWNSRFCRLERNCSWAAAVMPVLRITTYRVFHTAVTFQYKGL